MEKTEARVIARTRLGANGRLTIPAEYRRALAPAGEAGVVLIPVGEGLVIAPQDEALAAVTERMEAQMHRAGCDVDELIAAAAEARSEIVREEFGAAEE